MCFGWLLSVLRLQRDAKQKVQQVCDSVYQLMQDHETVDVDVAKVNGQVTAVAATLSAFLSNFERLAVSHAHLLSSDEFWNVAQDLDFDAAMAAAATSSACASAALVGSD